MHTRKQFLSIVIVKTNRKERNIPALEIYK